MNWRYINRYIFRNTVSAFVKNLRIFQKWKVDKFFRHVPRYTKKECVQKLAEFFLFNRQSNSLQRLFQRLSNYSKDCLIHTSSVLRLLDQFFYAFILFYLIYIVTMKYIYYICRYYFNLQEIEDMAGTNSRFYYHYLSNQFMAYPIIKIHPNSKQILISDMFLLKINKKQQERIAYPLL